MAIDPLVKGFAATQVAEALENYSRSDDPLTDNEEIVTRRFRSEYYGGTLYDDGTFWTEIFMEQNKGNRNRDATIGKEGKRLEIYHGSVTEWVARVPGLFWKPVSAKIRKINPAEVEFENGNWVTYPPKGKSQKVSGGVGTLRFPQAEDGFRLVTITTSCNASAGVPALISPDVWEYRRLCEGALIDSRAYWRDMPQTWPIQFPIVEGIPRGCLIIDEADSIYNVEHGTPILIHPFSVMEYWNGPAQLHDFVYATADTSNRGYRREISMFFEEYKTLHDRDGTYLLSADMPEPMWEATFSDPEEMRVRKDVQLRLIKERVDETVNGEDVAEALIKRLSALDSVDDLRRLSADAGIDWRRWSEGGLLAAEAARLVYSAIRLCKQHALLQIVLMEMAA